MIDLNEIAESLEGQDWDYAKITDEEGNVIIIKNIK